MSKIQWVTFNEYIEDEACSREGFFIVDDPVVDIDGVPHRTVLTDCCYNCKVPVEALVFIDEPKKASELLWSTAELEMEQELPPDKLAPIDEIHSILNQATTTMRVILEQAVLQRKTWTEEQLKMLAVATGDVTRSSRQTAENILKLAYYSREQIINTRPTTASEVRSEKSSEAISETTSEAT